MAVSLKHATQAIGTDAGNGEIGKAAWNDEHSLLMAGPALLGLSVAGPSPAEELTAAQVREILYPSGAGEFTTLSANGLLVDDAGNVGIGTSAPAHALDVVVNNVTPFRVKRTLAGGGAAFRLENGDSNYYDFFNDGAENLQITYNGTERMRVNSAGDVGIGTTAPGAKLHVRGNGYFGDVSGNGTVGSGLPGGRIIYAGGTGVADSGAIIPRGNSAPTNPGCIEAWTDNVERLRIDKSGNVGIGTAPSHKLQVAGSVTVTGDSSLTGTFNGLTTRYIAANNSAYIQSVYVLNGVTQGGKTLDMDASEVVFRTISGASYTERVRIDNAGNVLIGTATAGASKLVVNDNSIQLNTAKTPASATDTGTTGQICWDSNYMYACVAANTWKRAALSTW